MEQMLLEILGELKGLRTDVREVKTDIKQLKTDVEQLKTDVKQLQTDVEQLKTDVAILQTDMAQVKADVSLLQTDMAQLKSDVKQLQLRADIFESNQLTLLQEQRELRLEHQTRDRLLLGELAEMKDKLKFVNRKVADMEFETIGKHHA
ncbi:hypothetical protein ACTID9_24595 [Brevibacillus fluminis]|uniref:hypothetical protein n=1 Tax=Brevibacillus fluminis TaxID=511487 RepID=UPI003F8C1D68